MQSDMVTFQAFFFKGCSSFLMRLHTSHLEKGSNSTTPSGASWDQNALHKRGRCAEKYIIKLKKLWSKSSRREPTLSYSVVSLLTTNHDHLQCKMLPFI